MKRKFKKNKINYKLFNSFLLTLSIMLFFVSFMLEHPFNTYIILFSVILNTVILLIRVLFKIAKKKNITFEISTIVISFYLFFFKSYYQAYWCSCLVVIFSYIINSNMFMKSILNETYLKILKGKYHKYFKADTEFVSASEIKRNDLIELFSGETVPCDGVVKAGSGTVNTLNITGDNRIINISKGDKISAGYTVLSGNIIVEVNDDLSTCSLSRTLRCILDLGKEKTKKEKKNFKLSFIISFGIFVVICAILAILAVSTKNIKIIKYGIPLNVLFSFDIISCEILSDAYEAVISNLASKGIIVKKKSFIERNLNCENIGFSVKGVLSSKKPNISEVSCVYNITEQELIRVAAYALYKTNSSMAKVICSRSTSDINLADMRDFEPVGEYGGFVRICGDVEVVAGSVEDLNSHGIVVGYANQEDTIYVGIDGRYAGSIKFDTPLNEDIFNCMNNLRFAGVKNIFVYSHCNKEVEKQIKKLGNLKEVYGNLSNEKIIEKLKKLNGNSLMFRFGEKSADYSEYTSEIGYGGYNVYDRYDAFILTDNLFPPVNFVNAIKDLKKLIVKNYIILAGFKLLCLLMLLFNSKHIWLCLIFVIAGMILMRFNNLKLRFKV